MLTEICDGSVGQLIGVELKSSGGVEKCCSGSRFDLAQKLLVNLNHG
ncbi:MAG: hypothetical protein HGA84_03240 [Syntrophobacteraceae bacterium]|nr:hypothetical protein [Syntrophobacteraceae bacterium]